MKSCKTKRRTIWVQERIKNRTKLDAFHALQKEHEDQNSKRHSRFFLRMDKALKYVDKSRSHPSKNDALSQRCFNVGLICHPTYPMRQIS